MKKADVKTTTYETGTADFLIDIVETVRNGEKLRETWLYRKDFGVKDYVIGEAEKYWSISDLDKYAEAMVEYLETDTNDAGSNWFEKYVETYE